MVDTETQYKSFKNYNHKFELQFNPDDDPEKQKLYLKITDRRTETYYKPTHLSSERWFYGITDISFKNLCEKLSLKFIFDTFDNYVNNNLYWYDIKIMNSGNMNFSAGKKPSLIYFDLSLEFVRNVDDNYMNELSDKVEKMESEIFDLKGEILDLKQQFDKLKDIISNLKI